MSQQSPQRTPVVSVIMPSYNTAPLIGACLDSVFQQTFRDFEIVLVNDGSPDTPQLEKVLAPYLERHAGKIVYIKQPNKRCAGARNTAIRNSHGEFLAFLDSDDVWLPEHLAEQMKLFDQDPTLDLVYCNGLAGTALPATVRTWAAPVAHDPVAIQLSQSIGATEPLRTGTYAKTLTFTLSTTNP